MNKKKSINFILPLVVYPFDIMISIGESDESLKKNIDKFAWSDESRSQMHEVLQLRNTVSGRTLMTSCNRTILRMSNYPVTNEDYGQIAHEVFHSATFVLDRIGLKLIVGESDEAYSYLIQYITTEIYKRIK